MNDYDPVNLSDQSQVEEITRLFPEIKQLKEVFTATEGKSGYPVALFSCLMSPSSSDNPPALYSSEQLFYVKVHDINEGELLAIYKKAQQVGKEKFPLVPLYDYKMYQNCYIALYQPALRRLYNINSLEHCLRKHNQYGKQLVAKVADGLRGWHHDGSAGPPYLQASLFKLLRKALGAKRVEGPNSVQARTVELLRNLEQTAENAEAIITSPALRFTTEYDFNRPVLPNPLAFLEREEYWIRDAFSYRAGYMHGDLHAGNIMCYLPPEKNAQALLDSDSTLENLFHSIEAIDAGDLQEQGMAFFDYAYLEFHLILVFLRDRGTPEPHQLADWLSAIEALTDRLDLDKYIKVNPVNALTDALAQWIIPLRRSLCQYIAQARTVEAAMSDYLEPNFWLSTVAVGLNFLRKEGKAAGMNTHQRLLGLYYAACGLKRLREATENRRWPTPPSKAKAPDLYSIPWDQLSPRQPNPAQRVATWLKNGEQVIFILDVAFATIAGYENEWVDELNNRIKWALTDPKWRGFDPKTNTLGLSLWHYRHMGATNFKAFITRQLAAHPLKPVTEAILQLHAAYPHCYVAAFDWDPRLVDAVTTERYIALGGALAEPSTVYHWQWHYEQESGKPAQNESPRQAYQKAQDRLKQLAAKAHVVFLGNIPLADRLLWEDCLKTPNSVFNRLVVVDSATEDLATLSDDFLAHFDNPPKLVKQAPTEFIQAVMTML